MKIIVVFVVFVLAVAAEDSIPDLQQQQNEDYLNPIGDYDYSAGNNNQDKRTIFSPNINHGWAKHVGIHPAGFKYVIGYSPVDLKFVPVVRPLGIKPHFHLRKPLVVKPHQDGWRPLVRPSIPVHVPAPPHIHVKPWEQEGWTNPVHAHPVKPVHFHPVPVKPVHHHPIHAHPVHPVHHHPVQPVHHHPVHAHPHPVHHHPVHVHPHPVHAHPIHVHPGLFTVTKPNLPVLPLGATFPAPVLQQVPAKVPHWHVPHGHPGATVEYHGTYKYVPVVPHVHKHVHAVEPHIHPHVHPHLHAAQPHLHVDQPHIHLAQPHLHAVQPHLHVDQPHLHLAQPHLHAAQPHLHVDQPHLHLAQPHLHVDQPHLHLAQPHLHAAEPHLHVDQSHLHLPQPHLHVDQPHLHLPQPHFHAIQPQLHPAQPHLHINQPHLHPVQPHAHPVPEPPHEQHDVQTPLIPENHPNFHGLNFPQPQDPINHQVQLQQQIPGNVQHHLDQQTHHGEGATSHVVHHLQHGGGIIQPGITDLQLPSHLPQHPNYLPDPGRQFQPGNFHDPARHPEDVFRPSAALEPQF